MLFRNCAAEIDYFLPTGLMAVWQGILQVCCKIHKEARGI